MNGFTRPARSTEFGFMEAMPALVLIVTLFFGANWVGEAADESDTIRSSHDRAMAIAMSSSNATQDVSFDALEPTGDFVPLPREIADIALRAASTPVADRAEYELEIRVTEMDTDGLLRRVEVRVGYDGQDGDRTRVQLATVRQDWDATHARSNNASPARSRRPSSTPIAS